MFKQWSRFFGVDFFIEIIVGCGVVIGKNKKKKNLYSCGCVGNCKDFWCDFVFVFGQKENGVVVFGGERVDYSMMYESLMFMNFVGGRRVCDGYEVVGIEEVQMYYYQVFGLFGCFVNCSLLCNVYYDGMEGCFILLMK